MLTPLGEGEKENLPITKPQIMPCSVPYMEILSHFPENPSVRLRRKTLKIMKKPFGFFSFSYFPPRKEIELLYAFFVIIFFFFGAASEFVWA